MSEPKLGHHAVAPPSATGARLQVESVEHNAARPESIDNRAIGDIDAYESLRARTYALLAALLVASPDDALLQRLKSIRKPEQGDMGCMVPAWQALKLVAESAEIDTLDDEYHALFIGIGRGEVVPYASWYLTGFLMEQPLAALRNTLAALGYERQAGVYEPEDHAACVCETMGMMIENGHEITFDRQRAFFEDHIEPWMQRFFSDLKLAKSASFYQAVGQFGEEFIAVEKHYFSMPV